MGSGIDNRCDDQGIMRPDTLADLEDLRSQKARLRPLTDAEQRECHRLRREISYLLGNGGK